MLHTHVTAGSSLSRELAEKHPGAGDAASRAVFAQTCPSRRRATDPSVYQSGSPLAMRADATWGGIAGVGAIGCSIKRDALPVRTTPGRSRVRTESIGESISTPPGQARWGCPQNPRRCDFRPKHGRRSARGVTMVHDMGLRNFDSPAIQLQTSSRAHPRRGVYSDETTLLSEKHLEGAGGIGYWVAVRLHSPPSGRTADIAPRSGRVVS